jgi:hypothetical protein
MEEKNFDKIQFFYNSNDEGEGKLTINEKYYNF